MRYIPCTEPGLDILDGIVTEFYMCFNAAPDLPDNPICLYVTETFFL